MRLQRHAIRAILTPLHRLWRLIRPLVGGGRDGVHAIALTATGKVVLVRLTYALGWRLPGGGRHRGEEPDAAMLRELREEIGLVSHERIERLEEARPGSAVPGDRSALFRLSGVVYRPRRSFEIDEVGEFDPGNLPEDIDAWTRLSVETFV
jgi:8-oxo-dGTP pyrophosphatase MutT (NUDIX family)